MARPRSAEKHKAILDAATRMIAAYSPSVATAAIAKDASVPVGTLFKYFATKDDLLNDLYLILKKDLHSAMMESFSFNRSSKEQVFDLWTRYVDWGVKFPEKRKTILHLEVSDRITEKNKRFGMESFRDVFTIIYNNSVSALELEHAPGFAAAIMGSLATTTIDFMIKNPANATYYRQIGFDSFWEALAKLQKLTL